LEPIEQHGGRLVTEAALPDAASGDLSAGVRVQIARAHPRRNERWVLACQREEDARRAARIRVGERRLIAEAAQRAFLVGQCGGAPDAEHDLALQAKRLVPASVRSVEIS